MRKIRKLSDTSRLVVRALGEQGVAATAPELHRRLVVLGYTGKPESLNSSIHTLRGYGLLLCTQRGARSRFRDIELSGSGWKVFQELAATAPPVVEDPPVPVVEPAPVVSRRDRLEGLRLLAQWTLQELEDLLKNEPEL